MQWVKRVLYGLFFVGWLVLMACPTFFCALMFNSGQLTWGSNPQNQVHFFLLQEYRQEGLGVQWTRPDGDNPACLHTSVRYWMWAGTGENQDSCTCAVGSNNIPAVCQLPTP